MRGAGVGGGSDEREQTLNQILSEMDGFTPNETVIVMAATNRPDVLDSALLRPGRFDRHVTIDRPTWQGRLEILKVHTRNKPLADDVNLESDRPQDDRHDRGRPAQPGQRGGAAGDARGQEQDRPHRLRAGRRPRADRAQARGSADGRGQAAHGLPRGRPRPGRLAASRRADPPHEGVDHPARPGLRREPDRARTRSAIHHGLDYFKARRLTQELVAKFGELLEAWPTLVEATKRLRAAGRRLSDPV